MRGRFARLLLLCLVPLSLLTAAPAHAAVLAGQFHGTAFLSCFGCGSSNGTFAGTFSGVLLGTPVVNAPMNASFDYIEPPATCPLQGVAEGGGTIGAVPFQFTWTRLGTEAIFTFTGPGAGYGRATFVITSPLPNACGMLWATAAVAGQIVGI